MQLTEHSYDGRKPSRYYIDGKRVSFDRYDYVRILARVSNAQRSCFITRAICRHPGAEHYVHYSCINP